MRRRRSPRDARLGLEFKPGLIDAGRLGSGRTDWARAGARIARGAIGRCFSIWDSASSAAARLGAARSRLCYRRVEAAGDAQHGGGIRLRRHFEDESHDGLQDRS